MTVVALVVMAALSPVVAIFSFIMGYNINAQRKLFQRAKKHEKTEEEKLLERIDNARI